MAVSLSDMDALRQSNSFKARIRASMVEGAVIVATEAWSVAFHRERANYVTQILVAPDNFVDSFAGAIATQTAVINAATNNGAVAITGANADSQQASVTDAQIRTALGAVFNAFFRAPA